MSQKSMSSLSELAHFIGQSKFTTEDEVTRLEAVNAIVYGMSPRLQRRSVNELLGAVLALSARTRRMLLPQVSIELDVFAPNGSRAVSVQLPANSA